LREQKIDIRQYSSVNDLESDVLEHVNPAQDLYFSRPFLKGFENHHPQISFNYLLLNTGQESALVVLQNFTVDLESATSHLKLGKTLSKTLQCSLQESAVTLQLCGNVFLSGAYGITASSPAFLKEAYVFVASRMKQKESTSFSFFKDFADVQEVAGDEIEQLNFMPFHVEPNMLLQIQSDWNDFEKYKNALKSKYRVKVNRADVMSESLSMRELSHQELLDHTDLLQNLFSQVINHADFKSVIFNTATYADWKRDLTDRFICSGYFLGDQLVGFSTALRNGTHLDAHFIGIDYTLNKQHAIYPRMLNDYVRLAIALKCKVLNLGRTSSEIKSTLGAAPQPLVCYMRHKRSLANLIFKPITKNMSATDFKMHNPLKQ
jgi:hypothetical protein